MAQVPTCSTLLTDIGPSDIVPMVSAVPPVLRAEGQAERIGDIVLTCTNFGTQPSGLPLPRVDVVVFLNANVTNRVVAGTGAASAYNFTDAILTIEDPHSAAHPTIPLLACGAPSSGDDGTHRDSCNILGNGTGIGLYDGSPLHPNTFHGLITQPNTVTFPGIPISTPAAGGVTRFRISNLRINASQLAGTIPNLATAYVQISGTNHPFIPINFPQTVIGIVQPAVSSSLTPVSTLRQCASANPTIAADPTKPLDTGGQNGAQMSISIREGFPTSFRPKNIAQALANIPVIGVFPTNYPPDQNQNIIGWEYNTETAVSNGGADPVSPSLPVVSATPVFPAVNGFDKTGTADHGGRVMISFTGVAAGMKLFVPVSVPIYSASASISPIPVSGPQTGVAVLVATDPSGAGAYSPVIGNASGLAPLTVTGTSAIAVYEVLSSDPAQTEALTVPVAVAYVAGSVTIPTGGDPLGARALMSPLSTVVTADPTAPVPRFTTPAGGQTSVLVVPCGVPDLTVSMTTSGDFNAGTGAFNIVVQNSGDTATTGIVTLANSLSGVTATGLSGSGWACTLGTLTCTRTDSLGAGLTYPAIVLTGTLASGHGPVASDTASVSGGGETVTSNDTATTAVQLTPLQSITVNTSPAGMAFEADGITYTSAQTFRWLSGSLHTLAISSPQFLAGAEAVFNHWSDSAAQSHTVTIGAASATYTAVFGTPANTMDCVANFGVPPTVSAETATGQAGDFVLDCTGGIPTAAGATVPQVDFHLTFNTTVTSRANTGMFLDALLIVDEPHSASNPSVPLLACGASGSNDNGSGVCSTTGTGTGLTTYSGLAGHPNVFQGQLGAANEIVFKGIPLDSSSATRFYRFTNLRVNAAQLPVSTTLVPTMVTASIGVSPGGLSVSARQLTVAFILSGLSASTGPQSSLLQCSAANPSIAGDPTKPLDTGGQNGAQFSVVLSEGYLSAFVPKNVAQVQANGGTSGNFSGTAIYPVDANQNIPGVIALTSTAFFNGGLDPVPFPNNWPNVPPTAAFPTIRGLSAAGRADFGTRVYLKFSPVPTGMQLFVPVNIVLKRNTLNPNSGVAVLTSTDSSGAGAYARISGNAAGLAPVPVFGGVAFAVYEIVYGDPFNVETMTVPVAAAYTTAAPPAVGPITVEYGFAPLTANFTASSADPIPRYRALTANIQPAFNIKTCSLAGGPTRDFRGTGRSDVFLYDPAGGNAYAGLSGGTGNFSYVYQPYTPGLNTLRTGDFNGDGKADMVVYNSTTALAYIGLGNGDGTFNFQSLFWSTGFDNVITGDLNGDGKTDFVLYRSSDGTMYTALSNGTGGFTYHYTLVSIGFTHALVADFNGDGKADVFFYRSGDGLAFLGLSNGDGTFTFSSVTPGPGFDSVQVGDLNGDGKADLLLYASSNGATRSAISTGTGFTFATQSYSPGFSAVRLLDLNGDGKSDVVLYNKTNALGYFGIGAGDGTFTFGSVFWGFGMDNVEPLDLNGDGKADIVLYNSATGTAYAGIGNGAGGFAYTYSYWGIGKILAK